MKNSSKENLIVIERSNHMHIADSNYVVRIRYKESTSGKCWMSKKKILTKCTISSAIPAPYRAYYTQIELTNWDLDVRVILGYPAKFV